MSSAQFFHEGKFKLEIFPHEMKMSHWVYSPILTDTVLENNVFDLTNKVWDLVSAKETSNSIVLLFHRYPDTNREYELEFFPSTYKVTINGDVINSNDIVTYLEQISSVALII